MSAACDWQPNSRLPCSSDLAFTGDGPRICFAHVQDYLNARVAKREVRVEQFDRRDGLVEAKR